MCPDAISGTSEVPGDLPPQVAGSDQFPDLTLVIVVTGKKDSEGAQEIAEVLRNDFFFAPMDDAKNKPAAVSEVFRMKFRLVFFTRLYFIVSQ